MGLKFKAIWNLLTKVLKFNKQKSARPMNDAVRLPNIIQEHIVEDFEMAAYHNQA